MQRPASGSVGQALTPLTPTGNVEVDGESFPARSERGVIAAGRRVVVTGFDPWCLFVREPIPEPVTETVQLPPPGPELAGAFDWGRLGDPQPEGQSEKPAGADSTPLPLDPIRDLHANRRRTHQGSALKAIGILLGIIGALIFFAPTVLSWFSNEPRDSGKFLHEKAFQRLLFSTSGAVPMALGYWLFLRGKRLNALRARDVLRRDSRAPILLLRAFSDDNMTYLESERTVLGWLFRPITAFGWLIGLGGFTTFEELISRVLVGCAPVIAIGRPGETVPPLGAARFWVSNQDWQARVEELLEECQLVVMILGRTSGDDGLAWEIERLFAIKQPEKFVLVIPPLRSSELTKRWEIYRVLSGSKLPEHRGDEIVLTFTSEWACVSGTAKNRKDFKAYEDTLRQMIPGLSEFSYIPRFPET